MYATCKIKRIFHSNEGSNEDEVKESLDAIEILGGQIEENIKFNLPIEESGRQIVKIKKLKNTPKEYPRRYEKIVKTPLKKH